jgi:hypothetical protein
VRKADKTAEAPAATKDVTYDPTKPHIVSGLTLTAPQKRVRPGLVYVTAQLAAPVEARKLLIWEVEAEFADEDVGDSFSWEKRDGGTRLQVSVPDSSGIIVIRCVAIIDGKPTDSEHFAKTVIEVDYAPRKRDNKSAGPVPGKDGKEPPGSETDTGAQKSPVVAIYFVTDPDSNAHVNINTLIGSQGLSNQLRRRGIKRSVFSVNSERGRELANYVRDAGGAPCMILVTESKQVRKVIKLADTTKQSAILAALPSPAADDAAKK